MNDAQKQPDSNNSTYDARWNAVLTIIWSFVIIYIWQSSLAAYVGYRAKEIGIFSIQDTSWITNPALSTAVMQAIIMSGALAILMVLVVVRLKKGSQPRAYLPFNKVSVLEVLKWSAIAIGISAIWGMITQNLGLENSIEMSQLMSGSASKTMMYLATALAAPLAEELIFRGFIISGLERLRISDASAIAVAISSFLWTMLHVQYHAHEMFQVFLLGIVLGFARIKTRSLLTPILIHCLNNALAVSMLGM